MSSSGSPAPASALHETRRKRPWFGPLEEVVHPTRAAPGTVAVVEDQIDELRERILRPDVPSADESLKRQRRVRGRSRAARPFAETRPGTPPSRYRAVSADQIMSGWRIRSVFLASSSVGSRRRVEKSISATHSDT